MKYSSSSGIKLLAFLFALAAMIPTSGCGPTNGLPALTGEFLYVSNSQDAVVSEFSIDTATGRVTATIHRLSYPWGVAVSPSDTHIYVTNTLAGGTVSVITRR